MNLSFHALAWPCVAQAHFVYPTSGHFVQRCGAVPLGAALRQPPILFPLNPSTETKWRTSYDNDQSERFLLLVLNFYYWYTQDQFIEVTEEVAEALRASVRYEAAYQRRLTRHKAQYSLDCEDGIEYSACLHEPTPQELLERMELFIRLWNALNSLPEIQGRRIDAHIILGISIKAIAEADGVHEESVRQSIKRGLERMKKTF